MKWLLLIIFVSCGKQEMPDSVDMADSDGDQIANYQEDSVSKYIANFAPLEEIPGEMSFTTGEVVKSTYTIKFSNKRNLMDDSLEMLTQREKTSKKEEFFNEWSKLRFKDLPTIPELQNKTYQLKIIFEATEEKASSLVMITNGNVKSLGTWKNNLLVDISGLELKSLLLRESYLALGKKVMLSNYYDSVPVDTTIKEKTYRIFMNDGQSTKIFYVSKGFPFENFLQVMKLENVERISDNENFLFQTSDVSQWWARELSYGDKILAYTSSATMENYFKKSFTQNNITLVRSNGYSKNSLPIVKDIKSRLMLNVRPLQQMRSFTETTERVRHHTGGGGREGSHDVWHCNYSYRLITNEVTRNPDFEEIQNSLVFEIGDKSFYLKEIQHEVMLKADQNGPYYQIYVPLELEKLEIRLKTKTNDTYVNTGMYHTSCAPAESRVRLSNELTNTEGKLTLEVEALVEKMD